MRKRRLDLGLRPTSHTHLQLSKPFSDVLLDITACPVRPVLLGSRGSPVDPIWAPVPGAAVTDMPVPVIQSTDTVWYQPAPTVETIFICVELQSHQLPNP